MFQSIFHILVIIVIASCPVRCQLGWSDCRCAGSSQQRSDGLSGCGDQAVDSSSTGKAKCAARNCQARCSQSLSQSLPQPLQGSDQTPGDQTPVGHLPGDHLPDSPPCEGPCKCICGGGTMPSQVTWDSELDLGDKWLFTSSCWLTNGLTKMSHLLAGQRLRSLDQPPFSSPVAHVSDTLNLGRLIRNLHCSLTI